MPPIETLAPRHWPTWCLIGLFRLLGLLPLDAALAIGRRLGRLGYRVGGRRRRIAETNIGLCFPALDRERRAALVRDHFEALGMGLAEVAQSWWGDSQALLARCDQTGLEALRAALAQGRGVILVSAHFTPLEIAPLFLMRLIPGLAANFVYRRHRNPLQEWLITSNRKRLFRSPIERRNIRTMVRALRRGELVWYAADQNYKGKGRVFVDFFGVPAATNPGLTRLAQLSGAAVVTFLFRRTPDNRYRIEFRPLPGIAQETPETGVARLHRAIEAWLEPAPEQYFWLHRRFKTRPDGEPSPY